MNLIHFALAFFVASTSQVLAFETDKWDNQHRENSRFCGTKSYSVANDWLTCRSFWLPPVRLDIAVINAAKACAACWYTGPGCTACSYAALTEWFYKTAKAQGGALAKMPQHLQELGGKWLSTNWDDILDGSFWRYIRRGSWKIEARAGIVNHYSRQFSWLPWTSMQYQGFIQIKAEHEGHYIYLRNSCDRDISVAIRYLNPESKRWESSCWYNFDAGEGGYASNSQGRISTRNTIFYVYAESQDGALSWSGSGSSDSISRSCRGESFSMIKKNYIDSDGDLYTSFTCPNNRALSSPVQLLEAVEDKDFSGNGPKESFSNGWEEFPSLMTGTETQTNLRSHTNKDSGKEEQDDPNFWLAEFPEDDLKYIHDHNVDIMPACDHGNKSETDDCDDDEKEHNRRDLLINYNSILEHEGIIGDDEYEYKDTNFEDNEGNGDNGYD
eukprot:CAMPEP_0178933572 /NCGR_PEP_ID=MMETSP0786-20121207/23349_1 /TAXON_ID=186022 /ORGANISM="Thalassionema frauenfeldii, Strain CCMP 1798" /LENGTH=440 /DNA_ID=CAMNT_0020611193 /DNA_START=35 /DNA_END=1357 /DNA_ORIENTATION=-